MPLRSFMKSMLGVLAAAALLLPAAAQAQTTQTLTLDSLQRRFVDKRFGMFIHFNFNTYYAGWAESRQNPKLFNPTNLNCRQWASAAKSAGMTFGLLTCKHHDGFAIWQSKFAQHPPGYTAARASAESQGIDTTPYSINQSSVPNMDVVDSFTTAFRDSGLWPCLYFSMWDPNNGIPRDTSCHWTPAIRSYVLGEITELLTNYGEIPMFWFDGYSWAMGHNAVPWQQIRDTIKALQPNCLIIETNGMREPWESDILFVEEPLGNWTPPGNTFAACQAQTIGDNWFWDVYDTTLSHLQSVGYVDTQHIQKLLPVYSTFILDCPPNLKGLLDNSIVTRLAQIGPAWNRDSTRAPLPPQVPMIEEPITPVSATATSGVADSVIDDHNDWTGGPDFEHLWRSKGKLPQSVTLDLGQVYTNVSMLFYLPRRDTTTAGPTLTGNILKYQIFTSTDSLNYTLVSGGTMLGGGGTYGNWAANRNVKKVSFSMTSAKFVRLEIDSVVGAGDSTAIIQEIGVGGARLNTAVLPHQMMRSQPASVWQTIRTANGYAVFNPSLAGKLKTVAVYDMSGKLLSTRNLIKNSISLEKDMGLPSGFYVVKVKELRP